MAKAIALHTDVYNLLIVLNINNFTVSEVRDALMYESKFFNDENETRKYIYRVILKLTKLKLLIKHTHSDVRKSRYIKSEAFSVADFVRKSSAKMSVEEELSCDEQVTGNADFFHSISKEKAEYEAEFGIILSEVREFKGLMKRFPKQNDLFKPLYLETRNRSVALLGKINALEKVLSVSRS